MKKFNYKLNGEEKTEILEMHSKLKKTIISEQGTLNLRQRLEKILSDGCVKNGKIVSMSTQNPELKLSIKQESTRTPGKFRYFFVDNRVGIFDDGGKFTFSPSKWSCAGVQQAATAAATATSQQTAADIESKIQSEIKKGWKKIETLRSEGADLTTLDRVYDTLVVGNVTLYRPKGESTTFTPGTSTQEFNSNQQSFVDRFIQKGYKLNPSRLEQSTMVKITDKDLGAPADLFPNGLVMFYDPNLQSDMRGRDGSVLGDIITNQSVNKNVCRKNIDDYYEAFKRNKSIVVDPATIVKAKRIVQACKDEHYGQWGVAGGGKRLDNYLDILSGNKGGGPTSYGRDSAWRIQ